MRSNQLFDEIVLLFGNNWLVVFVGISYYSIKCKHADTHLEVYEENISVTIFMVIP